MDPATEGSDASDAGSVHGSSMSEATVEGLDSQSSRVSDNSDAPIHAPFAALPQTEALRARAMNRNKPQRSRNKPQHEDSIVYAAYAPDATVPDSTTKNMLLRIYDLLHYLDCRFAEYFTSVVEGDAMNVSGQLRDIRRRFAQAQNPDCPADARDDDLDVNLGDLGHFCEQVLQAHEAAEPYKSPGGPRFHVTCGDIMNKLNYLQDALEVPYWKLMLRQFVIWRVNSPSLTDKVILSVIRTAKYELKVAVAELRHQGADNLAPIIKGIESRIELLDSVKDSSKEGLHVLQDHRSYYLAGHHVASMPSTAIIPTASIWTSLVSLWSAGFLLGMAIPFFALGFRKASAKGGVGSSQDADFYFLVQGNVMSTLGSVLMVVPMLRRPRFSPVYIIVWLMLGGGLVCSIVSVAIFAHVHTGWSNAFVLFGSVLSAWAVLIMAHREGSKGQGKVKAVCDEDS